MNYIQREVMRLIMEGLAKDAIFDNDGGYHGLAKNFKIPNFIRIRDTVNNWIERKIWTQKEFEVILFNYIENDEIISIERAREVINDNKL